MSTSFSNTGNLGLNSDYTPIASGGGGGAVTSVFGRTGAVIAVAGDYNSSQVTNSSSVSGAFVTDALNWLDTNKLGTSLTSANIIVGNASNVATAVAMSGDATISNTGAVTLANSGVIQATYGSATLVPVFAVDSKGRVTSVTNTAITGLLPSGSNLNTLYNNSGTWATNSKLLADPNAATSEPYLKLDTLNSATKIGFEINQNLSSPLNALYINRQNGSAGGTEAAIRIRQFTNHVANYLTFDRNTDTVFAVKNTGEINTKNSLTYSELLSANTLTLAKPTTLSGSFTLTLPNGTGTSGQFLSTDGTGVMSWADAAGGGYVYSAITLSGNVIYNKSDFAGANYINLSTNDSTIRELTIGTGFIANDFLVLNFNQLSPAAITLKIGGDTFSFNVGNSILAVYDGTNWNLNSLANAFNTSGATNRSLALGLGSGRVGSDNTIIGLGNSYSNGSSSVHIGSNNTSSNVSNSVLVGSGSSIGSNAVSIGVGITQTGVNTVAIGQGVNTGGNTGVVAIGQGITSTNTDAVVIGRAAGAGGTNNISIGAGSTGSGNNIVRIGNNIGMTTSANAVVIGQALTTPGGDGIIIGITTTAGSNGITIGNNSTNSSVNSFLIGNNSSCTATDSTILGNNISAGSSSYGVAIGRNAALSGTEAVVIGYNANGGANSVSIGKTAQGTGINSIRIGSDVNTSTNTGVVAIGQGITTTNMDAVVIGRAASGGGTANVTIGGSATGTGANCVRIGNGVQTGSSGSIIAIGTSVNATASTISNSVIIGNSTIISGNCSDSIVIGDSAATNTNCNSSVIIGQNGRVTKPRQFGKGRNTYPRHYGAESRRIDTNISTTDATNPSRHSDNTAWIGSTNASTLSMVLFAQSGENLTVQDNELLHFMVMISAKKEGATDSRVMIMNGAAVASGGTATIVGQGLIGTSDFNNSAGAAALVATIGATSNYITMTVNSTDPASTGVWQWTANIINITRTRTA